MKRTAFALWLFAGWFLTIPALAGEPMVVDLWPGKPPGDVGISGQETSRIHASPLVGPTKLITNVSKPTVTVYQPARDKNTGTAMVICPGGGYWDLYWELEGEEVAAWLNSVGITGIILATGDHDFGVRLNEKLPSSWTKLCLSWLRSQHLLTSITSR